MTIKQQAKFLANFAKNSDGRFSKDKLIALFEYIKANMDSNKCLALLRQIKKIVSESEASFSVKVEYAGELSSADKDKLKDFINKTMNKDMDFSFEENESLIAGLKITASDILYENTLSSTLKSLGK
ncbi:MAG: F0F1 ATP synthase subunit delta [Opitutales bacterium]